MKKIRSRAVFVLLLAFAVLVGTGYYVQSEYLHGRKWALYFSVFNSGSEGAIYDRNGKELASFNGSENTFQPDQYTRIANYHVTGDYFGRTGTGILSRFWSDAQNYDFIRGTTHSTVSSLTLTVDSDLNNKCFECLSVNGKGAVMILNYRTGEILALVSTPSVDPIDNESEPPDGAYVNRALSATYIPGSTFKLITSACAIENIPDLDSRRFQCYGEEDIAGVKITCETMHGSQTFAEALANSCNCVFAQITVELGFSRMYKYVSDYGFLDGHTINGIYTSAGNYLTEYVGDPELAWSGIGQSVDQVCPFSMLRYVAAIANDGVLVEPTYLLNDPDQTSQQLVAPATAQKLQQLMRNNVATHYEGDVRFPGLDLCAKTGTAEIGTGASHSWFTGFLQDEAHPYAFVAVVEEGGYGLWTAGLMMNEILQYLVAK